jgi:hypothetical protein
MRIRQISFLFIFMSIPALTVRAADPVTTSRVQALVSSHDTASLGTSVLPVMVALYRTANETERGNRAEAFYGLGWRSAEAKSALMRDVHTQNQSLRLQVQWALGRVSGDLDVVDVLLDNMQRRRRRKPEAR